MCNAIPKHEMASDLAIRVNELEIKIEQLRVQNPLVYATLNPVIGELIAWMKAVREHIKYLHERDKRHGC